MSQLDLPKAKEFVVQKWADDILPSLSEFIKVPNQSPLFDKQVLTNGLQEKALAVVEKWIDEQNIAGLKKKVLTAEGRTPLLFLDIPGTNETQKTILAYSHLDKQPPFSNWDEGLGPYTPVVRDGKLYGRGGADDGYGIYATLTALKAVQLQNLPHARLVMVTEFCEESGSFDLPYYLDLLQEEIGTADIVFCLDTGCGNYDQLWLTTSLRGMLFGVLNIEVSSEGVHSGMGSGVIPSTFRIARELLDRIEDSKTGKLHVPSLYVDIPEEQLKYADATAEILGNDIITDYPFLPGVKPVNPDPKEAYLNRSWRPTLSYTGIDGIPTLDQAGNVLRPQTAFGLSFRLPPTADDNAAYQELKQILEANPPYNAKVTFVSEKHAQGFYAPPLESWLADSVAKASNTLWGKAPAFESCGGSIPILNILREKFPQAQFLPAGVLGPKSNAHAQNEFLHIGYFYNLVATVSQVIADHYVAKVE